MKDQNKTKEQLIKELEELRQRLFELENFGLRDNRIDGELRKAQVELGVQLQERITALEKTYKAVEAEVAKRRWIQDQIHMMTMALESSINGVALADLKGHLTYVNDSFVKQWGYDDENEVLGRSVVEFWESKENASEVIEALRDEGAWAGEMVAVKKNGLLFDVEFSARMVMHENGKPFCMMGSFVDVTEHKQAKQALTESEEKYKCLFENSNDAIFIADTKTGKILDANRQAEKLIGRPKGEIIGMHQSRLHPPQHAPHYEDKFRRHVQKGWNLDMEAEIIKKDGRTVPVFISSTVMSFNGQKVILGLFKDISNEKRILALKEEIETRKLIEKVKGMLMDRHKISEQEAMRLLQKESRRQRKKIKEIANMVSYWT